MLVAVEVSDFRVDFEEKNHIELDLIGRLRMVI